MDDNYWEDRNIAELSWFLATGEDRELPKLGEVGSVKEMQIAYLGNYIEIQDALMRALFIDKKAAGAPRITDFSRASILRALERADLQDLVAEAAKAWLEGSKPTRRTDRAVSKVLERWTVREWPKFLAEMGYSEESAQMDLLALQAQFREEVVLPKKKRLESADMREDIKRASREIHRKRKRCSDAHRSAMRNRYLYSPELNVDRRTLFYINERSKMEPFGDDPAQNQAAIKRRGAWIRLKLEGAAKVDSSERLQYGYLLNDDGSISSTEEIEGNLYEAQLFLLGEP